MKFNTFYLLVLVTGVALITVSALYFKGSTSGLPATATAKELVVRSGHPAAIAGILVRSGQTVKKGDTLLVLTSLELSDGGEKLQTKLSSLETEKNARLTELNNAIRLARNDISLEITRIREEINQSQRELDLNAKLTGRHDIPVSETPIASRIRDLNSQIELYNVQLVQKENELRSAHAANQTILQNQIDLTVLELKSLRKAQQDLVKVSDRDAVVQAVPVAIGSVVDAYSTVVTLLPSSPTTATAYLSAGLPEPVIGSEVKVEAFGSSGARVAGTVIGYGSMVPLPEILQKSTAVKAFGKEVFVSLPEQNGFTTGEKLLVKLSGDE